jgi:hypothetical protein
MINDQARKIFWGVVFLSLAIFGSWMLATGVKDMFKAHAAKEWPITMGVVVSSEAVKGCSKSYSLEILYRYTVGSTSYLGNRLTFGVGDCGSRSDAQAKANQYTAQLPVAVHFNPALPSEAVILPQVSNGTWWLIFIMPFGIVLFIFVSWRFLSDAWMVFSQGRNLQ